MIITDDIPAAGGTENERLGLILDEFVQFLQLKEMQQIQSISDLQATVSETQAKLDATIKTLADAVNTHASKTGAVHGENKSNIGLKHLNNWRSSVLSDITGSYSDQVYLTSDMAKIIAEQLVTVDFDNFMTQGQLPIAYFKGGTYGSLMKDFRQRIGYLKTTLGFINTNKYTTKLLRVSGGDDLSSNSYPMQSKKKISFISNQDNYLFTAPGDKYGMKSYAVDKYFMGTPVQEGFDPTVTEITDQPYTVRNVGWGGSNHFVRINNDDNIYTLFNRDFYLGLTTPPKLTMASGNNTQANFLTIPGSPLFNTLAVGGSLQLSDDGINIFLGGLAYSAGSGNADAFIMIDDTAVYPISFVSPNPAASVTPVMASSSPNLLAINGLDNTLSVVDDDNLTQDLIVGKNSGGSVIPWDNVINFVSDDHRVNLVDFSDVDPFFAYGNFDWENFGTTFVGYIDGVVEIINHGNIKRYVFRCGLRISITETILVELLEGVVPTTFNNGVISGGNTLFEEDVTDPLHPIYGRGMFLEFGGHISGMTRETDIALSINQHQFTDVVSFAKGYFNTAEYTRKSNPVYPADRLTIINSAARRIVPVKGTTDQTKLMVIGPTVSGELSEQTYRWDNVAPLYTQLDSNGEKILRSPSGSDVTTWNSVLAKGTLSVISTSMGVSLSSLVFGQNLTDTGVDYYTVGTKITKGTTWSLSANLLAVINGLFPQFTTESASTYRFLGYNVLGNQIINNWTLVMEPNGTSGATISKAHLVLSDTCGKIGYIPMTIVPNSTNNTFDTTDTSAALYKKIIYGKSAAFMFDRDTVDTGNEYYDVTIMRDTSKNYLHLSRAHGTKHGGAVFNITDGVWVNIDTPQVETGDYPVSNDFVLNYLPISGSGCFYMKAPSGGLMTNGSGSLLLDMYNDDVVATVVDTDGVKKYRYVIPEGTTVILAGIEFVLKTSVECLFDSSQQCYLYLSLNNGVVTVVPSLYLRQPTIYEALYGMGSSGFISMTTEPYCVINDKLLNEGVIGSGIPETTGDIMATGASAWKLK